MLKRLHLSIVISFPHGKKQTQGHHLSCTVPQGPIASFPVNKAACKQEMINSC